MHTPESKRKIRFLERQMLSMKALGLISVICSFSDGKKKSSRFTKRFMTKKN